MASRLILVDPCTTSRETLTRRLLAQGYLVEPAPDAAVGAEMALSSPPTALIADLWMPSISGIQLCRLLGSEPATAEVPVILRGDADDPRSRFWAERAGAFAYVRRGSLGELVRAVARAVESNPHEDPFFMQLSGGSVAIRDRIAQHLDAALFESVIASEIRALASCGSLDRLLDLFSQFLAQVHAYRWLAVSTASPERFAVHSHPRHISTAQQEARQALGLRGDLLALTIEDEDALELDKGPAPVVREIHFSSARVGQIALAPASGSEREASGLLDLVARELGGPIRMASLVEESQRLASVDPLTGLMNRRSFTKAAQAELARAHRYGHPTSLLLLDVDHFKAINDHLGHASGDSVLTAIGGLLLRSLRESDLAARWGGEEFVVLLPNTDLEGGRAAAERLRAAIAALQGGPRHPTQVTVSIGVGLASDLDLERLTEQADRAMYRAKTGGRNRVEVCPPRLAPAPDPAPPGALAGHGEAVRSADGTG